MAFGIDDAIAAGLKIIDKFIPDPEAKIKAEQELRDTQKDMLIANLQADNVEAQELTKRLEADMKSDSWLSKNIRPMTLIYILTAYLALAVMDALGLDISDNFVSLLGQWGMLVMSFYFGGRTLEKVMDMKAKK